MTDLEKFIDTYKQFGIDIKTNEEEGKIKIYLGDVFGAKKSIITTSNKFEGYSGFCSILLFTQEGKFISQGFWE